jgi:SAM-dependent methyltransferase
MAWHGQIKRKLAKMWGFDPFPTLLLDSASSMAATPTLNEVHDYWNEFVNDIEVTDLPVGTPEFFDALERYRYDKIDYLRDYVGFPRYQGKKVLEIGCGVGLDLIQFARAGAQVTAIDLTENAAQLARANLGREGYQGDIRVGNAEALDFSDNSFDVVYSHGVLHHTVDTEKAVAEVAVVSGTPIEHAKKDAPIIRRYTARECRQLFGEFRDVLIHIDRFPKRTVKFDNLFGKLNNYLLVPFFDILPDSIKRPFGWHIMIRATK